MSQTGTISSLASLPSPLPPAPDGEVFTDDQWEILFSIVEVFLPSISSPDIDAAFSELKPFLPENASEDEARAYLSEDPTKNDVFRDLVVRKFKLHVPPSDVQGLGFILSAFNTWLGSYLLTGYTTPIHKQDLATRARIVCQWSCARLPLLRAIYRSLNGLARQTWLATSVSLPRMLDFPATPKHIERNPSYEFKFHDFTSPSTPTVLSADVVIVGSGCGAGVVASHLSRAGLHCLVLEKSYHFPSTHFPMSHGDSGEHLMENGGIIVSDDASMGILVGSTFGGGGTINWSASLQPPYPVREEWASEGLPHFLGPEYQDCLDTICERMGVAKSTDPEALGKIEHNFANQTLLEGSRRLGLDVQIVPQNTDSKRHFCGYCTNGCAGATKQGPANCWFPEAAAHGAQFIEGCWVEEVTFADQSGTGTATKQTATGVKATWTSRDRATIRQLTISAKRVIIAAGTFQSPLVLLRSGLKNPHIGSHLHLHPTNTVWATWPHRTNPWEGAILTVAMTGVDDLDGHHHGAKVEVMCSTPGLGLLTVPFRARTSLASASPLASAAEYRVNAAKHAFSTGFVCIARDADTGRVYLDPKDASRRRPRIAYTPSERDCRSILEGMVAALRIAFTMGAVELEPNHPEAERWVRPSHGDATKTAHDDKTSFDAWIVELRRLGFRAPNPCTAGSAHQMGSCRMSGSAATGVVDAGGRVFGTEGLYVADASVFPSASGVNPMVSTMGIAEWISRGIVRELETAKALQVQ
ncbi:hypothetical protein PV04_02744 [Phialophora macrospora]|uniref:Long-chain-alcohol oxidase n=1 Tax=Phialophora macrospora TaxID=1851006 RepID=A0A0D2E851_9EURO|nr:hypothetical protein PV04_02744 [Phialophora macrospora]